MIAVVGYEAELKSVDGYTIVDVPAAEWKVGPIRSARKVLQRTTTDLVRHATYACAIQRLDACGAAAALNFDRASEGEAPFKAFAQELDEWATEAKFVGSVAMGLSAEEAGPTLQPTASEAVEMAALSAAASSPVEAQSFAIVSSDEEPELRAALGGNEVGAFDDLSAALSSGVDVLFVRGKTGCLDHAVLADTNVRNVIGLQPLTTTARGLAVAGRAGTIIVPDYISAAGPILAALGLSRAEITNETRTAVGRIKGAGVETFVRACELAEEHLRTMTNTLPFGRPLAP